MTRCRDDNEDKALIERGFILAGISRVNGRAITLNAAYFSVVWERIDESSCGKLIVER